jgi:hypothetical protein
MASVAGKRDLTGRVLALLKRVADPIVRSLYLQRLAQLVQVEERVLADALQREPIRRAAPRPTVAIGPGNGNGRPARLALSPLEASALELLLRHPSLVAELADEPLPLRDATAAALAAAWRDRVAATDGEPDLETFVAGLDPASRDLAHDLLADGASGEGEALDAETAAEVMRVTLLRLRVARLEEDLRDGRLLLEEAQREADGARLATLEQQMSQLGREKAEATKAMQEPAGAAGVRRS